MSRKRGKDKRAAKQAVPEEILAEGSGPNEVVEANAQSLADAASDALGPVADVEVRADVEPAPSKKRSKKTRATTDAWGQPIEVDADDESSRASDEVEATADARGEADVSGDAETTGESAVSAEADGDVELTSRGPGKKGKRKAKAAKRSASDDESTASATAETAASAEIADAQPHGDAAGEEMAAASGEGNEATDESVDESSDHGDEAEMQAEPGELTAEAQSEQALEDAVMRAEAEAELGEGEEPAEGDEVEVEVEGIVGAALPTTAANMDPAQLKNLVEALVFAADKPVTLQRLRQLTRVSDVKRLEQALAEIAADYTNRGIVLQQVSGGYQFRTNTQYSVWVQQLIAGRPVRLSRAQLETLAIVAYRQPITRPEVDEIRGVDSSATLRLLLDRSLIRVLGKKEDVGRPTLYGTTKEFLDFFSLSDLRELPTLREYSELTAESRKVMSDRLGIDADGNAVEGDGDADGDVAAAVDAAPDAGDVAAAEVVDLEAPADADVSAPDIDVEAQLAADDAAAVEAVSAVTSDVAGIVDANAGSTDLTGELGDESASDSLSSDDSTQADDSPSVDAVGAEPMSADAAVDVSTSAAADDVESMRADASTDEAYSSDAHVGAEAEPMSADAAIDEADSSDAHVGAEAEPMSADAADVVSTSGAAEDVQSMSAVADDVESMSAGADDVESMSAGADDVESMSGDASTDDAHRDAHVGVDAASPMSAGAAHDAELTSHREDDDKGAMFASSSEQDLGAPRGSSQDDVIAITHDAAHDPDELGDDHSHDLGASAHDLRDAPTGNDAGTAGAGVLEDRESDVEASGTPNPEIIDASAPDRLDETDEPPAD